MAAGVVPTLGGLHREAGPPARWKNKHGRLMGRFEAFRDTGWVFSLIGFWGQEKFFDAKFFRVGVGRFRVFPSWGWAFLSFNEFFFG